MPITGSWVPCPIATASPSRPTVEGFELDTVGREGLAVAIGHGTQDPVIGIELGRDASRRLDAAGLAVTYRESPMYSIDPRFAEHLVGFVARAVEAASSGA